MAKCPYCHKKVSDTERYCYFCEEDISKVTDKEEKPKCFIATAAYGTPYAQEIYILRRWRDNTLNRNLFGKIFVKFYYTVSPPIADYIRNKKILKKSVRSIIDVFIKLLR